MTYDVDIKQRNGKTFLTPLTIHGMPYGMKVFDWAKEFVYSDKNLTPEQVRKKGTLFHKRFVEYCKSIAFNNNQFGSDPTGYYYDWKKLDDEKIEMFKATLRWLHCYIVAMAFDKGIEFG